MITNNIILIQLSLPILITGYLPLLLNDSSSSEWVTAAVVPFFYFIYPRAHLRKNFLKDFLCVLFFLHGHYEYLKVKKAILHITKRPRSLDFSAVMKNLPLATTEEEYQIWALWWFCAWFYYVYILVNQPFTDRNLMV